jgi:hypothetical protein
MNFGDGCTGCAESTEAAPEKRIKTEKKLRSKRERNTFQLGWRREPMAITKTPRLVRGPAADENGITRISEWKRLQTMGNWNRHASQCKLSVDGCGERAERKT